MEGMWGSNVNVFPGGWKRVRTKQGGGGWRKGLLEGRAGREPRDGTQEASSMGQARGRTEQRMGTTHEVSFGGRKLEIILHAAREWSASRGKGLLLMGEGERAEQRTWKCCH